MQQADIEPSDAMANSMQTKPYAKLGKNILAAHWRILSHIALFAVFFKAIGRAG